jgi:pimeloyl-ACP methyl ester carboxylesterase
MQWNFRFNRFDKTFHYQLHRKPGPGLVVILPYLRPRHSQVVQFYSRIPWYDALNASCLFVADPGLTKTVRGTWFQGDHRFYALEYLAADIRLISKEFGFKQTRTVLYGYSLGGFAALGLGAYLRQAKIVADAPQTDLRLPNPPVQAVRDMAAQSCYDVPDMNSVPTAFQHRLCLPALYTQQGFTPRGKIWARDTDTHCVNMQLPPLLAFAKDRFEVTLTPGESHAGGHASAPAEQLITEINSLLGRDWWSYRPRFWNR